jgi:hypothetical protein
LTAAVVGDVDGTVLDTGRTRVERRCDCVGVAVDSYLVTRVANELATFDTDATSGLRLLVIVDETVVETPALVTDPTRLLFVAGGGNTLDA